jgi:hypothetical protein
MAASQPGCPGGFVRPGRDVVAVADQGEPEQARIGADQRHEAAPV